MELLQIGHHLHVFTLSVCLLLQGVFEGRGKGEAKDVALAGKAAAANLIDLVTTSEFCYFWRLFHCFAFAQLSPLAQKVNIGLQLLSDLSLGLQLALLLRQLIFQGYFILFCLLKSRSELGIVHFSQIELLCVLKLLLDELFVSFPENFILLFEVLDGGDEVLSAVVVGDNFRLFLAV